MEYQLALQLPPVRRELGRPYEVVGLSLARSGSNFSEEDRQLLELLQPIFAGTLRRLHDIAYARAVAVDIGDTDHVLVLVDETATIAWTTAAAEECLDATVGHPLPASLQTWLTGARSGGTAEEPMAVVPVLGRPFRPRLVPNAYPGLDAVHLTPARSSRDLRRAPVPRPHTASVRSHGPGRRQQWSA